VSESDSLGSMIGGNQLNENTIYTTALIVIGEIKSLIFSREKAGNTA
jgi:hypothetical protein